MSLAIICPNRDLSAWISALRECDPTLTVETWPEIADPARVEYALCWNQPAGTLRALPNLRCASSLGAGVNHLLDDATCPADLPLVRLVDSGLQQSMAEYVLHGVLERLRGFADYRRLQARAEWGVLPAAPPVAQCIGVMGYGAIGRFVADRLAGFGCDVHAWSRTPKGDASVALYAGEESLAGFLGRSDILVCLLPLTGATRGILNQRTFSRLPRGAYLINVARGAHLAEADLLAALADGQLSGALLDVFAEEPLPAGHPFWTHPGITVTPHIASVTNPRTAASQVVDNYRRALAGEPLLNLVDRRRGY